MNYSDILPEETVASFLIRQVLESGYPTGRIAQKYLWGNENLQINCLFPSLLPWIVEHFNFDIEGVVSQHTCLNYYRSFLNPDKYARIKSELMKGNTKSLHKWLGITANRVSYTDSFRYCLTCVGDDISKYGVAYWHRQHQLYGVLQCSEHGTTLCSEKITRRSLVLPPQISSTKQTIAIPRIQPFTSFSQWAMVQNKVPHFNPKQLIDCYRLMMLEKGLASKNLTLKQLKLRNYITNHYQDLTNNPEWRLIFNSHQTYPYPQQIFYNYNSCNIHPAKHLALIAYLFKSPNEFLNGYHSAKICIVIYFQNNQVACSDKQNLLEKVSLKIMQLALRGKSLRNIAKQVGLSIGAVKSKVLANGGAIRRRPSKIFASERRAIYNQLLLGTSSQEIASQFEISTGAVEQLLTQHPELVRQRRCIRFMKKQVAHRTALTSALSNNPNYSRNQLKIKFNMSYLWLFKNDKKWLYQHLPPRKLNGKSEKSND